MRPCRFIVLALTFFAGTFAHGEDPAAKSDGATSVRIDAAKTGEPINPFIYGQFIEHLGRCIYGGIWAEMLEDRKFYFPITDKYDPYRSLKDTDFPVVGASPWQIHGRRAGQLTLQPGNGTVTMIKDKPFVGEHSPLVAEGSAIQQNDLSLIKGKKYIGYVWAKAPEGAPIVTIRLSWDETETLMGFPLDERAAGDFVKIPFECESGGTTDKGSFSIEAAGAPVLIGTVSLMPADNVRGKRADTLALLKELDATMYRWPGGNFVSGYNWRDGIGPRDRRPPRKNPAWTGVEHNDFGLDEFIDFCREVGAEPMIAANTGFGDDYSAAQEVEYTNGSAKTIGGSWRVENGHAEPYNVKYWCVGNEMWGNWQLGHMRLDHYALKHNLVAKAMHEVDPKLVLVASGDLNTKASFSDGANRRELNWSQGMLEQCADSTDLISEHFYKGRTPWGESPPTEVAAAAGLLRDEIRKKAESHRELQKSLGLLPDRLIPIAMDEWNYWHNKYVYGELGCQYNLTDALGVAIGLHEYFRNSDVIHMAHYAQTVNVIGCIKTTKTGAFLDATALPLMLYRREFGTQPLTVSGNHADASIDVAAAKTDDGKAVTVGIVNPNSNERSIQLSLDGLKPASTVQHWQIADENPELFNTVDKQPLAIAHDTSVAFDGKLRVRPYSINVFRIPVE
jgi:alpha-N-arabinofuranosidase